MKMPEENKKRLIEAMETASWVVEGGDAHDLKDAVEQLHASCADALAYIQQLERERDAAADDMRTKEYYCETCAHYTPGYFCPGCRNKSNWQWRGVQEVEE